MSRFVPSFQMRLLIHKWITEGITQEQLLKDNWTYKDLAQAARKKFKEPRLTDKHMAFICKECDIKVSSKRKSVADDFETLADLEVRLVAVESACTTLLASEEVQKKRIVLLEKQVKSLEEQVKKLEVDVSQLSALNQT